MSTNNNASQTLFRFVSLRNPQLTETKERNLGFIHRPKGATGLFDAAVAGASSRVSKLNEMMKVAIGFSNAGLETEKKSSRVSSEDYWLSEGKSLNEKSCKVTNGPTPGISTRILLIPTRNLLRMV
uniref:Uncharacterized protein n=1 Tax=Chryseobacterium endophyticum TaxID=1854762 RepID=A0AAU6WQJ4_9FLAO